MKSPRHGAISRFPGWLATGDADVVVDTLTVMRKFGFVVEVEPAAGEPARVTIDGRCAGGPLRVNDLFVAAERHEIVRTPSTVSSRVVATRPLLVMVLEIRAYGRVLPEIEQGLTARLLVELMSPGCIVQGDVLLGDDEHDTSLSCHDLVQARAVLSTDPVRWVTVSVRRSAPTSRALDWSKNARWALTHLDSSAASFGSSAWESGLLSGILYSMRLLQLQPDALPLVVEAVEGSVAGDDVEGVAVAASAAVWRLLGAPGAPFPAPPDTTSRWIEDRAR